MITDRFACYRRRLDKNLNWFFFYNLESVFAFFFFKQSVFDALIRTEEILQNFKADIKSKQGILVLHMTPYEPYKYYK